MADLAFTLTIDGVDGVLRRIAWTPADAQAMAVPLLESGRAILDQARPNVPVLTGNLRSTGKVLGPISRDFGYGLEVRVEYGGKPSREVAGFPAPGALAPRTQVDYAAVQHETNPRRPKWLEDAFLREAPRVPRRVAARLEQHLGRKVRIA